ncbi:MAG TPA: hypothetical protein VFQ54_10735 [Thermomicrobiales bacterium]|nr:hypothetical protein [Thermomicrobiales bacterium]
MLPFNPDIMNVAIAEQQERIRIHMLRAQARGFADDVNLLRRLIGRALVWSGRRVGGPVVVAATTPESLAPVIDLGSHRLEADRNLERAA